MLKCGVLGFSEGNGHPISFSSIINGFNENPLRQLGFDAITEYLTAADENLVGIEDLEVSHIWCDDPSVAASIADAANIRNVAQDISCLSSSELDLLFFLFDESDHRLRILETCVNATRAKIYVDKPLYSDAKQRDIVLPLLFERRLISCSFLRFDPGVLEAAHIVSKRGPPEFARAIITGDPRKYLTHAIEPMVAACGITRVQEISCTKTTQGECISMSTPAGHLEVQCIRSAIPMFKYDFFWGQDLHSVQVANNLMAFRNGLLSVKQFLEGCWPISPDETKFICDLQMEIMESFQCL